MSPRPPRRWRRLAAVAGLATALVAAGPVAGQEPDDPALDQVIAPDQAVASGPAVLGDGHVDIGPRLLDGTFTLMVHDDAEIPAVWRHLEDAVLAVGDEALQAVPDDPTYSFLGVEPGTEVWVVPQVQRPGVVWVGWNTQDPAVMESIDRGATLTLLGVQGPGQMAMYLQSGNLGAPEVLWRSTVPDRQPIWVEVNTHTHANWVFTEPGVYLVQVEIAADVIGGDALRDVRTLRFAIGDATDPDTARAARADEVLPAATAPTEARAEGADDGSGDGSRSPLVVGVVALVALVAGVAAAAVQGGRAKRRAEQERATGAGRGA